MVKELEICAIVGYDRYCLAVEDVVIFFIMVVNQRAWQVVDLKLELKSFLSHQLVLVNIG